MHQNRCFFFFSAAGNNNKSKKDRTKPVLPDRGRAVMMDVDDVCQSWRCKAAHRLAALQPEYSYNVLLQRFCVSPVYCIVKPGQSGVGTGSGTGSGNWNGDIGLRSGIPRRHA